MATFNQFQKELQNRGIDPQNAYMLTLIYERLIETEKLVFETIRVVEVMAGQISQFVALHEATQGKLNRLARGMREDGVDVFSVAPDPDEKQ